MPIQVDMDSGFVFTVFLTSGCLAGVAVVGFERVWRKYGTVRSVSWSGTQISLGSIYPGDTFVKVGK